MTRLTDAMSRWAFDQPHFREFEREIDIELRRVLGAAEVAYERVTTRTKDTPSLARKLVKKGRSYDEITDKLGARVIVRFPSDVDRAVATIHSHFGGTIDDKRLSENPSTFAYRSVHIDVIGLPDGRFTSLMCEVQVRTVAEDSWAVMSHFLSYKSPSETPLIHMRSLAALAALFEIADLRYEEIHREIVNSPDFEPLAIISGLEASFYGLGGGDFDSDLSRDAVDVLRPAYGAATVGEVVKRARRWAEENAGLVTDVIRRGVEGDSSVSVFATQPELLLLGELLASGSIALLPQWSKVFEVEDREGLADNRESSIAGVSEHTTHRPGLSTGAVLLSNVRGRRASREAGRGRGWR